MNRFEGKIATYGINAGTRTARLLGFYTSDKSKIDQIVVSYSDGSTFTLQNAEIERNLTVNPTSMELYVGDTRQITPNKTPVTYTGYDSTIITVDTDGTVHGVKVGTTSITVTYGDAQAATVQVEVKPYTPSTQTVPNSVEAGWSKTITLSANKSWYDVLNGLPLTAPDGTPYIYYIQESTVEGYVPISYTLEGVEGEMNHAALTEGSTSSASFQVTNAPNSEQSSSVELPTSGGRGTRVYYTIGGLLLLLSAAGYTTFKRRRWFNE